MASLSNRDMFAQLSSFCFCNLRIAEQLLLAQLRTYDQLAIAQRVPAALLNADNCIAERVVYRCSIKVHNLRSFHAASVSLLLPYQWCIQRPSLIVSFVHCSISTWHNGLHAVCCLMHLLVAMTAAAKSLALCGRQYTYKVMRLTCICPVLLLR